MKKRGSRKLLAGSVFATVVLLGPASSEAQAYIDPGTGSSLFASLGVLLGVTTAVFALGLTQLRRLISWLICKVGPRQKDKPIVPDLVSRQ